MMQDVRTQEGWLLRSFECKSNIVNVWRAQVWKGVEVLGSAEAPTERAARRRALKAARERK